MRNSGRPKNAAGGRGSWPSSAYSVGVRSVVKAGADVSARSARPGRRQMHDQRHLEDLGKDRVRVPHPSLLAERVAVIGGHDDEAVIEQPA